MGVHFCVLVNKRVLRIYFCDSSPRVAQESREKSKNLDWIERNSCRASLTVSAAFLLLLLRGHVGF